jgi:hypothetical protein
MRHLSPLNICYTVAASPQWHGDTESHRETFVLLCDFVSTNEVAILVAEIQYQG